MLDTATPDEAVMVDVAIADLHERFPSIENDQIEATVRRQVHEWRSRARVTTFVGIIAGRAARAELAARQPEPRAEPVDTDIDIDADIDAGDDTDRDADAWVTLDERDDEPVPDDADRWVIAMPPGADPTAAAAPYARQ
jgi:hypothetical protein